VIKAAHFKMLARVDDVLMAAVVVDLLHKVAGG
jgi:hypothetical protein